MSVRPVNFTFQLARAFGPWTHVELSSGNLVVSSRSPNGTVIAGSQFQVTPPNEAWERFWDAVQFLDVWSWKPNYDDALGDEEVGRDGERWTLHFNYRGRIVNSTGTNSYPSFRSVSERSHFEERFGMFVFILEKLLSHKLT